MLEKVTRKPLEKPRMRRPKYTTPLSDVAIWMDRPAKFRTHANHRQAFRPKYAPKTPAIREEMNAPSVSKEVINCCTVLWYIISAAHGTNAAIWSLTSIP
jgi:hypothetical protein